MLTEKVLTIHSLSPAGNAKAIKFFDAVAYEVLGAENLKDKLQVILVAHAYENILAYVQSLNKVFTVAGIIFKNSTGTLRPEYAALLTTEGYKVLDIKKSDFYERNEAEESKALAQILECLDPGKQTIIMDHGAYFAFLDGDLLRHRELSPDKLIAITEYAANGEERWKKVPVDRPVISIGYSKIKEASDFAAAESVVDGAVAFSQSHNVALMAKETKVGVIGFGRLGSGIVAKLNRNYANVSVYDVDELKMSGLRQADVVSKEKLLRESDVIFCATGNRCITPTDFDKLKDGVVIFTVTSPDDEINLPALINKGILVPAGVREQAHVYKIASNGRILFLPYNGESANIIFSSSVNDPTILQPYALHTVATIKAHQHLPDYSPSVQGIARPYEDLVARVWNQHYNPAYNGVHPFVGG